MSKPPHGGESPPPPAGAGGQTPWPPFSETSWAERREFEELLAQGKALTARQTTLLIAEADLADRLAATLAGLEKALLSQGIVLVDATTDDDDGEIRIELVRADDAPQEPL